MYSFSVFFTIQFFYPSNNVQIKKREFIKIKIHAKQFIQHNLFSLVGKLN